MEAVSTMLAHSAEQITAEATIGQSVTRYEESDTASLPSPNSDRQEKQGGPITDKVGQRH